MKHVLEQGEQAVAVIDLEASGLGYGTYPIEVGVALIRRLDQPVLTWSMLIKPTADWLKFGLWSSQSAAVHGILISELQESGRAATDVADWLNATFATKTIVASDAPRHDQDWLDTLFRAADREQLFTLRHLEVLTSGFSSDDLRQLAYLLKRSPVPHRAGPDASRLATLLIEARLGYKPQVLNCGDPLSQ